jgi:hypothetical protein
MSQRDNSTGSSLFLSNQSNLKNKENVMFYNGMMTGLSRPSMFFSLWYQQNQSPANVESISGNSYLQQSPSSDALWSPDSIWSPKNGTFSTQQSSENSQGSFEFAPLDEVSTEKDFCDILKRK